MICGQKLGVQVKTMMSDVPQVSRLGPMLFNNVISDMGSVIECALSKFADDVNLSGAVNMLEGRYAVQISLNGLERWVCVNFM